MKMQKLQSMKRTDAGQMNEFATAHKYLQQRGWTYSFVKRNTEIALFNLESYIFFTERISVQHHCSQFLLPLFILYCSLALLSHSPFVLLPCSFVCSFFRSFVQSVVWFFSLCCWCCCVCAFNCLYLLYKSLKRWFSSGSICFFTMVIIHLNVYILLFSYVHRGNNWIFDGK